MTSQIRNTYECRGLPNVLLVGAECAPLAKTGGLADVIGTLPKSLAKTGIDARVIMPYHKMIKEKYGDRAEHMLSFYSGFGWGKEYVGLEKLILDGTVIYLIDSEKYFGNAIYLGGDAEGEQYSYFCRAVLDALPCLDFVPEVLHCNDWHTAMIPMLARTQYKGGMQEKIKYLLTIHNIAFQGKYSFSFVQNLLGIDSRYFTPEFMELYGCADYLKAGCVFADRINTVSPSYAEEIKQPYYAEGLDGILNARSAQLSGIVNGIDSEVFDPSADKYIAANYALKDRSGKAACKKALQEELGLNVSESAPIVSMVTRMTEQKGFDLVIYGLDDLLRNTDMQFVLLGSGEARFEDFMRGAEARWKGRVCSYIGYNDELAHRIYAGSDYYLMPSRFEPCGISQMIAMRYGTVPIVRETGGLKDTVKPYNEYTGEGTGFSFANYNGEEMKNTVRYALSFFGSKEVMKRITDADMEIDFGFDASAREYKELYSKLICSDCLDKVMLEHNSADSRFRRPVGAVRCGEDICLKVSVNSGMVVDPVLVLKDDHTVKEIQMIPDEQGYHVEFKAPDEPEAMWYSFRFETCRGERWLCPDHSGYKSRMLDYSAEGFRLTVYDAEFETPDWLKHSVMYQIFPDRFAFSDDDTAVNGIEYHRSLGQKPRLHRRLSDPVAWQPRKGEKEYFPDDFYGGTLKGIIEKLPYLKDLGISCIYLNPIVEARSNHRYDTSDYMKVDPILGTNRDFSALCRKAGSMGIRIILDGVFSHTGADSIYFNIYDHYDSEGACQGEKSKYHGWYLFDKFPDSYRSWWGIKNLPEVDERNPSWQNYIFRNKSSVMKTWMNRGASGWRLDVADEIPDDVLEAMRTQIKSVDKEAPLIGEVWEDPIVKVSYSARRTYALGRALDSVMNYPLRTALLDFAHFRLDAPGLRDFLINQQINYPKPLYYSLMNLIGSHDVARVANSIAYDAVIRQLPREKQLEIDFTEDMIARAYEFEKLFAAVQFSVPGVPSIYYGDEQGMTGTADPFNRTPFRENKKCTLYSHYKTLAQLRNTNPAMRTGEAVFMAQGSDVLVILRYINSGHDAFGAPAVENAVVTVINRSDKGSEFTVDCSYCGLPDYSGWIGPVSSLTAVLK